MLKSGERVGVGEGGLKMGQRLGRSRVAGYGGRLRRRACVPAHGERADAALAEEKAPPEPLPGPGMQPAADAADRVSDAVGDGVLKERTQQPSGDAHASYDVRTPNADGASAAGAGTAV